ncbi:M23 family metallopeptidase [Streptomyces kaniharaensis]|uniref:M23 family metallopeptidase n=1 Tax=Streptomyces kaniharaensis TaxID=212423 RepID=A0A6N7KM63_9ACTN|nr:M23 family metallopeptidase [Streptomyces kaniharaensis]MQS12620.1 M23 family metallopeptidase [Streptomyces kaniharaensis]
MAPDAAARLTRAELRLAAREQSRAQRRGAAKAATRAALFRVAVPSMAALGVAAAAAITVVQSDTGRVPAQASAADAPDDTAARTTAQQAAAADNPAQASRGDARQPLAATQPTDAPTAQPTQQPAQPKVVMPVAKHGLGELFGAAGTHWANRHTGIDFPVDGGSEVYAVTDGTIRTQWNPFYGYMSILKMPDGTEAWFCHLRGYKVRKGPVKQGDVIAFVGSSGNSTGPHLHFEIRPAGSGPVDPLPWFLSNGLDPR